MSMFLKCGGSGLFFLSIVVQQLVFYVEVVLLLLLLFLFLWLFSSNCCGAASSSARFFAVLSLIIAIQRRCSLVVYCRSEELIIFDDVQGLSFLLDSHLSSLVAAGIQGGLGL